MNHIYRLIFNRATGLRQVVSETAHRGHGGSTAAAPLASLALALAMSMLAPLSAQAANLDVNSTASLNSAIAAINAGSVTGAVTLTFTGSFALTGNVAAINPGAGVATVAIIGNGTTLSGGGSWQGLFVQGGAVSIDDLAITGMAVRGGNSYIGGGGAGLGGGLLVGAAAHVTLTNVNLANNSAAGGNATSGSPSFVGGQLNGRFGTGGSMGAAATGADPTGAAGGDGSFGVGGGLGGSPNYATAAGNGGAGGAGGFGAGGGGGGSSTSKDGTLGIGGAGGAGGFGGGAGTASGNITMVGYTSSVGYGGGGAGMGGGLFVQEGGTVIIGGAFGSSGNTVAGGSGVNGGAAYGAGMFLQGNGSLTFAPGSGQTQTVSDAIADQSGSGGTGANAGAWAVRQSGPGTLVLAGANSYSGGTLLDAGTVQVAGDGNLGAASSSLTFNGGRLSTTGAFVSGRNVALAGSGTIATGGSLNMTGVLSGAGDLSVVSGGTISMTNAANDFGGAVNLTGTATTISAARGLSIGTFQTTSLNLTSHGPLGLGGGSSTALSASSNGGAITQTGAIAVAGTSSFNAGGGAITLTNAGNNFAGAVSANGANVSIANGNQLTLANVQASGALNLVGSSLAINGNLNAATTSLTSLNGGISQTAGGAITTQSLTGASAGATTLSAANQIVELSDFSATDLTLNNGRALAVSGNVTAANVTLNVAAGTTVTGSLRSTDAAGGTTVNAGNLRIGNGGTTGSLEGNVIVGTQLLFDRSNAIVFSGTASGVGSVSQVGTGTLTFTGANSYGGSTSVSGGTLQAGATRTLSAASAVSVASGATLDLNSFDQTIASLAGAGNVVLGSARLTTGDARSTTFGGAISGSGAVVKQGVGTWTLSGARNNFTGATSVNSGTLRAGASQSLSAGSAMTVAAGATLDLDNFNQTVASLSGAGNVTLGAARLTLGDATRTAFTGTLDGSGDLVKQGAGTLTLSGDNSYSGGTALKAGRIDVGSNAALGTGALAMDDGTALGFAVNGLALSNAIRLTGSNDPVIDTGAFDASLSGGISGGGFLTKQGTGTLTLAAANNTYAGATDVAAGTLRAGAANAFSAASMHTVAAGATLDTGGFSQSIAGLSNSGTVSLLGTSPGSTLTVTGPYVGNGGVLKLGTALGGNASASDRLLLSGRAAVASGNTTVQITNLGGLGGYTTGVGIEVVGTVGGASINTGAFSLANGHVDAGAFEYRLNTTTEGAYLSNLAPVAPVAPVTPVTPAAGLPLYRAEVPLLAALPEQLRQGNLAMLGNLHQRIGDDDVTSGGAPAAGTGERRAWGRVLSTNLDIRQQGTVSPASQGRLTGFQAGTDLFASTNWRAGVYVGRLDGDMQVSGFARGVANLDVGSNSLRSEYLAAYGSYTGDSGFYADAVLQGGRHRYDASPLGAYDASHGKADSLLASIELGQAFALAGNWKIEPQLQLVHQRLNLDDVTLGGATVRQDSDNGWLLRAGVRVKGEIATGIGSLQPYARVNVYRRSSGTDVASFAGQAATTAIVTRSGGTSSELALGATLALNERASVYGEIGRLWGLGGDAKVRASAQGSLGVRFKW